MRKNMVKRKRSSTYPSIDKPWEFGHSFFGKHPIIPNTSIYRLLKLLCMGKKDKTVIECGNMTVSYRQMFQDAKTVSTALTVLGVKRGDIITICMPNFYQAIVPFFACNRIGAIATYLNPGMSEDEIKEHLKLYSSPVLFNFAKTREENASLLDDSPANYIITVQPDQLNNSDMNQTNGDHRQIGQLDYHSLGYISEQHRPVRDRLHIGKSPALIL